MKILFYDGYMPSYKNTAICNEGFPRYEKAIEAAYAAGLFDKGYRCFSAADGPTSVTKGLDGFYKVNRRGAVMTNSVIALNNTYAWNEETNSCDIWFWKNGEWVNIQDTTEREIRQAHNIMHMYLNDAFDL